MTEYHESWDALPEEVRTIHRALKSLIEEIEAVDWYHQRAALTDDASLKGVLEHNRDEEIEHACMALEWLRRNMPKWDEELRTYLFTEGDIASLEEEAEGGGESSPAKSSDLGIGKLNGGA
ncbi:MAG: hypothetical protein GF355_06500 [Candidatus Eisenbacteria bacterium]|nr:hypothetical protein [Candidatus Eisenbacteria bacterium]